MDINHEGIYYLILSGKSSEVDDDDPLYSLKATGYEDVTKEEILEVLQTYFGVDFGYDVEKWRKYIEKNGGWFYHYWENRALYETERKVIYKYR